MENFRISQQRVNPQALAICQKLNAAGHQAFVVGGCVRDLLLGLEPKDWDITTDATPNQVMNLFKTIPTGLKHGTVTVVMGSGVENHFEVTTFRIEGNYVDGRRPEEVFFVQNIEQDLARRDLTINAIAYDPITDYLADPFFGTVDLQAEIIKAVGNPVSRFQEDGLRIMRAIRFAARFGYEIDPNTLLGMQKTLDTLKMISKERIQDELCKTLQTQRPSYGVKLLQDIGALAIACPGLQSVNITAPYLDICLHGELETKLALLFIMTRPEVVQEELIKLKFPNKQIKKIMFLFSLLDKYRVFSDKKTVLSYKSFMAVVKNHSPEPWERVLEQFILFSEALGCQTRSALASYQHEIVLTKQEMQINGNDLMEAGVPAGPQLKSLLDFCYLEILRHPEYNSKELLLKLATAKAHMS